MPASSEYWKKRFEVLEDEDYKKSKKYIKDIEVQFREAQNNITMNIERWYRRLAENNDISLSAARQLLKKDELKEFHWSVEQYIKAGEENAVNLQWMKQLENASAKVHISRLEAMKFQMQQHAELLYAQYHGGVTDFLNKSYSEHFYRTAYEIQKGTGIGSNLAELDIRKINKVLATPWAADGKNFSDRIWSNKEKMVKELHRELAQSVIRGDDPQKAIDNLSKVLNVNKNNAGRLVMTEMAAISSAAQNDCFKELDVEQYEIVATLDSHTSDICQGMDGKHFKMSEWEVGITAPPFHVWCRTVTVPYFEDDYGLVGERAARGEDGKTYYVPEDMKYEEWKKTFVAGGGKTDLIQIPQINDEKIRNANEEFGQILLNNKSTPYNDKMILYNEATEYQLNENLTAPFAYNPQLDVIQYNPYAPNYEMYDMNFVQAHELSHRMDELEYHSWQNEKFLHAIENMQQKVYDNVDKIAEWFSYGGKYDNDMALSDIFSALSGGKLNDILYSGHPVEYWQESRMNVCKEICANMASIDVMDYTSKTEFNGILKEIYEAYKEMVE